MMSRCSMRAVLFLAIVAGVVLVARPVSAQEQCFPDCREGFVCNPEGICVSQCNPVCGSGERCVAGECYVRVKDIEKQETQEAQPTPAPPGSSEPITSVESAPERIVVVGGGFVIQFQDYDYYDAVAAYGMEVFAALFPSSAIPYFIRPRLIIAFGEDDNYYEPYVDVGYVVYWQGERLSGGVQLAGELGLWPNVASPEGYEAEPVGPYLGAAAAPFLQFGRLSFTTSLRHGYQLGTDPNTRVTTLGLGVGVDL